ncbi:hypothetical protein HUT18_20655 [Streptomyces sp. NA04227]|uniref:hypothetical protein n=1 Tax=Streptomyces sp. NA04227 TaxID=2742136 RepID=UPI001590A0F7|nr:hypothetical protein [Streptomyces sp. NA04227]QKW08423.1 hypothetical protein HUT18_20655 [Streptomyces sp. NA04227]
MLSTPDWPDLPDSVDDASGLLPSLLHELWDLLNSCEDLIEQVGGGRAERRELRILRTRASAVCVDASGTELRQLMVRVREFQIDLLRCGDRWDVLVFHSLADLREEMTSRPQADAALAEGRRALAEGDREALSAVNRRLRRLLRPGGEA